MFGKGEKTRVDGHSCNAETVSSRIWSLEVGDQLRVTLQVSRVVSSFHFTGEHAAVGGLRTPKGHTTIRLGQFSQHQPASPQRQLTEVCDQ